MISTGLNFPDALAGGVLAAKMKVPVLLVNKYTVEAQVESYIRLSSPSTIYVLGGESVIPQSVAESLC